MEYVEKKLDKIEKVRFGHCGYDNTGIGISFTFSFDGCGLSTDKSGWDAEIIKHSDHCKWSEEDRDKSYAEIVRFVSLLLKQAKVSDVSELQGKPIEVTIDRNSLKEWRILEEVL